MTSRILLCPKIDNISSISSKCKYNSGKTDNEFVTSRSFLSSDTVPTSSRRKRRALSRTVLVTRYGPQSVASAKRLKWIIRSRSCWHWGIQLPGRGNFIRRFPSSSVGYFTACDVIPWEFLFVRWKIQSVLSVPGGSEAVWKWIVKIETVIFSFCQLRSNFVYSVSDSIPT